LQKGKNIMAKSISIINIHIGKLGNYEVEKEVISGLSFIPTTKIIDGETKRKSIPVRRHRINVSCTHDCGENVTFSAYIARGLMRFADSRRKGSEVTSTNVVTEMQRMLNMSASAAQQMLQG
jgi:hypothetical protein